MDIDLYKAFLERLGVNIDTKTFRLAMTHRSYAYENGGLLTNERLEFLGDAILGFVIAESLYLDNPNLPEGELAKRRSAVVNTRALAGIARQIGLGQHIRLGRGEVLTGGKDKDSILADTFEAVIGAVYLCQGMEKSKLFVKAFVGVLLHDAVSIGAGRDWKTNLQEIVALAGLGAPRYEIIASGPDHAKRFFAKIFVNGEQISQGEGNSKKEAEKFAAQQSWEFLSKKYPKFAKLVVPHA